jgi:hypothetical protein
MFVFGLCCVFSMSGDHGLSTRLSVIIPSLFVLTILQTLLLCARAGADVFDFYCMNDQYASFSLPPTRSCFTSLPVHLFVRLGMDAVY